SRSKKLIFFDKYSKLITHETRFFSLFVIVVSSIVMILIITLGLISWPVADDFSFYIKIRSSGVLGNAWNMYTGWDGRFFASLLHVPLFRIFKFGYTYLIVAFNTCCFILTAYVLSVFLTQIISSKKLMYYDFAIMLSVLWLGLIPIIKEVVHWA
ncbi:unnamed protein product, partial [marine sediment metagenome]